MAVSAAVSNINTGVRANALQIAADLQIRRKDLVTAGATVEKMSGMAKTIPADKDLALEIDLLRARIDLASGNAARASADWQRCCRGSCA
jgi:hypothetical protein